MLELNVKNRVPEDNVKVIRKDGDVPGVIYGSPVQEGNILFSVERKIFIKHYNSKDVVSKLFVVNVGEKKYTVFLKDFAMDPVSCRLIHLDLQAVQDDETVLVDVPIKLLNMDVCVGIKLGGKFSMPMPTVEVRCLPSDIPHYLEVNMKNVSVGQKIRLKDISLSGSAVFIKDPDNTVLSITGRKRLLNNEQSSEDDGSAE